MAGKLILIENAGFVVLNSNYFSATCDDSVLAGCSLRVVSLGGALLVMSPSYSSGRVDQGRMKPMGGFEQCASRGILESWLPFMQDSEKIQIL